MSSRTGTPMEQPASNGSAKSVPQSVSSPEPVYRFYLSPPPTGAMQTGFSSTQPQSPEQSQVYPSMGMHPFNPYMMSPPPPPQGMASVSAFGHPAYYAPAPQSMYYPSAFGMPAMPGVQARTSNVSSISTQPQAKDEEAKTPIVNEAGVPMGGFGTDQDGQYIEIKFPTFGQAQVQQMLQQMHIHQQAQGHGPAQGSGQMHAQAQAHAQAQLSGAFMATNGMLQPQPQSQQQSQPQSAEASKIATPVSAAPSEPADAAKDGLGAQNISIYDAENFADAHMEDIVFDRKAFFWKIDNWDKLERRATSDVFKCGGFVWRILLRPFGSSHKGVLSLFLECLGTSDTSEDWRGICRFVLAIANPHDPTHNTHGSAYHCFHRNNPNWGFTRFMKLADLRTAPAPGVRPYIEDGACTIGAYLHVVKDPSQ
ncbi:ubiquitin-specific protease ubp15 [Coemansia erecta]|nr:ubiquitin-specific protease ubp15 [Coemansia sp. RSA 2618]KAJ2830096.1 ubiquitin-specific protease ubp15 [Coemansia erecta]